MRERGFVRRIVGLGIVAVVAPFAVALLVAAAEVRILSFESDGTISWTNDYPNAVAYDILQATDPFSAWTTNASGTQNPKELTVTNVPVVETQKLYRISTEEPATDVDLSRVLDLETNWFSGGDELWFEINEAGDSWDGVDSAQSGAIGHDEESWFAAYFEGPVDLDFYWLTDCEEFDGQYGDYLAVFVGTTEMARVSGDMSAWENEVLTLGLGTHLVTWKFVRDDKFDGGRDAAWVDHVTATRKGVMILQGEEIGREMSEDEDPIPFDLELTAYVESGVAQWSIYSNAMNGVASTNGGSATNQVIGYKPDTNWWGTDAFIVQIESGLELDRILVNVEVEPVNDRPAVSAQTNANVYVDTNANIYVTMSEDGSPTPFALALTVFDPDTDATNLKWTITDATNANWSGAQSTNASTGIVPGSGYSRDILYAPPTNWNTYAGPYSGCMPFLGNSVSDVFNVNIGEWGGGLSTTVTVFVEIEPRNDPPTNEVPPVIGGTANVGKQVSVTQAGTWVDSLDVSGTPGSCFLYTYQWQSSPDASAWTDISGATASSLTLTADHLGLYIRTWEYALDRGEGAPSLQSAWTNSNALGPVGLPAEEDLPPGMVFVAKGNVILGGLPGEEAPRRTNYVGSFYIDTHEVSKALWDEVRTWGSTRGYTDLPAGQQGEVWNSTNGTSGPAASSNHPVTGITWFDCAKWCNARSEMDGKTPAYYTDGTLGTVYRTGSIYLSSPDVDWDAADGYRLPTEAEWEKAARGGVTGWLYPWGDSITNFNANYRNSEDAFETDGGAIQGTTPVGYYDGGQTPAGPDMANGYGLYDVAGNVREWCWDRYATAPPADETDPKGPDSGLDRLCRGGAWHHSYSPYTQQLRCADRMLAKYEPGTLAFSIGLRTVRKR